MQHNEQPPPTPEEIARMVAEIQAGWTPEEEFKRRTIKPTRYTIPLVSGVDDDDEQSAQW